MLLLLLEVKLPQIFHTHSLSSDTLAHTHTKRAQHTTSTHTLTHTHSLTHTHTHRHTHTPPYALTHRKARTRAQRFATIKRRHRHALLAAVWDVSREHMRFQCVFLCTRARVPFHSYTHMSTHMIMGPRRYFVSFDSQSQTRESNLSVLAEERAMRPRRHRMWPSLAVGGRGQPDSFRRNVTDGSHRSSPRLARL